jgi:diguanylate cyclase (GGDEF)-like protein
MPSNSNPRTKLVPALVLVLGLAAIVAITLLLQRSDASQDAELKLANVRVALHKLQSAPFQASPTTGGSPEVAAELMQTGKQRIRRTLDELSADSPPAALAKIEAPLRKDYAALDAIYAIGASGQEYGREADQLAGRSRGNEAQIVALLDEAGSEYGGRAGRSRAQATIGSATVILLLLLAFGLIYRRAVQARATAERLADENERLLAASREEATTDALTGLCNRRALMRDLDFELASDGAGRRLILALYDLDGFKLYNDTFGHPAGDALLARLGERLQASVDGFGTAYRMGGDEFCVLVPAGAEAGERIVRLAAEALAEHGEGFSIQCSYGAAYIPAETRDGPEALRLADQRMYEDKAGGSSASRQSTDVLLKVLSERLPDFSEHLDGVSRLAGSTANRLGLSEHEIKRVILAGELHDIGKMAVPDAVLNKPSRLDEHEWEFIRTHTVIGERIVRSAPSLAHTANLIRSSHERYDGTGYPDGLSGDEIPLGASIVGACDAFDAMLSERPYRAARPQDEALAELRRCSGTQFHPRVVEALCAVVEESDALAAQPLVRSSPFR